MVRVASSTATFAGAGKSMTSSSPTPTNPASFVAPAAGAQLLADPLRVPAQMIARSDQLRGDQTGPMPLEHRATADPQLSGELSRRHQRHDRHRKRLFCALTYPVRDVSVVRVPWQYPRQ